MGDKSLGQIAFEAYNASKGGLTWDGKPIPGWDELTGDVGHSVRVAWEKAAEKIVDMVNDVFERSPTVLISRARGSVATYSGKSRESSICLTKLDEAAMWHAQIPMQAP